MLFSQVESRAFSCQNWKYIYICKFMHKRLQALFFYRQQMVFVFRQEQT